jgi:hypothetical protein
VQPAAVRVTITQLPGTGNGGKAWTEALRPEIYLIIAAVLAVAVATVLDPPLARRRMRRRR